MGSDLMLSVLSPWLWASREAAVLVSMLPFGPWSRFSTGKGSEESWSVLGFGGLSRLGGLDAFSVLFWAGTSLSYVKAFLTGYRGLVLTSYRVWRVNQSEGPLRAFWRHVRLKAWKRTSMEDVNGVKENPITARCAMMG